MKNFSEPLTTQKEKSFFANSCVNKKGWFELPPIFAQEQQTQPMAMSMTMQPMSLMTVPVIPMDVAKESTTSKQPLTLPPLKTIDKTLLNGILLGIGIVVVGKILFSN